MKRAASFAVVIAAILLASFVIRTHTSSQAQAQDPMPRDVKKIDRFMHVKLKHAQEVLEGLAQENFDQIAKNAHAISLLSLESNWNVLQTKEYLERSVDFREAVDKLEREAKRSNLDGATLAYIEMTLNCVNCHKYVRTARHPKRKP